jgi:hypothetical protein
VWLEVVWIGSVYASCCDVLVDHMLMLGGGGTVRISELKELKVAFLKPVMR